jgi:hypothetical protein
MSPRPFSPKPGERFGRLVVRSRAGRRAVCDCDCGGTWEGPASNLKAPGNTASCGCLLRETSRESRRRWNLRRGEATRAAVRRLHAGGRTAAEIAAELGLNVAYVCWLRRRLGLGGPGPGRPRHAAVGP